jgi:uncharacterized protein (UPF0332 family)
MDDSEQPFLDKARECLIGAVSELGAGRYNNAAGRAYYAAYNAAIVVLIRAGYRSDDWSHRSVQSLFGELTQRRKLYPPEIRRVLPDLLVVRLRADYGLGTASRRQAQGAVRDANTFVERILETRAK